MKIISNKERNLKKLARKAIYLSKNKKKNETLELKDIKFLRPQIGINSEKLNLIVKKKFRGQGIGKKLYKKFIEIASQEGVRRAEWVALDWNVNAIKFYKNSGAKVLNDWKTIQIDKKSIKNYLIKK